MQQNQNQGQDSNNPGGRQNQGWDSNQNTTIPNQEPTRMDNDDINEIPGEHHNKEHRHDYKNPTGEQNKAADENRFPHEWSSEKDHHKNSGQPEEQVNPTAGRDYRKLEHQHDFKNPSEVQGEILESNIEPHEWDRKWYQQNKEEEHSDFPDEHQEPDFQNDEYKEPARGYDRGEEYEAEKQRNQLI